MAVNPIWNWNSVYVIGNSMDYCEFSMNLEEQLKYWQDRGGQIEWRLNEAKGKVRKMEFDLHECDVQIEVLKERLKKKEIE